MCNAQPPFKRIHPAWPSPAAHSYPAPAHLSHHHRLLGSLGSGGNSQGSRGQSSHSSGLQGKQTGEGR